VPELPETETIARDLDPILKSRRIERVVVRRPDVLRGTSPRGLARRVHGAVIAQVWRRAKSVVLDLDTGDRIVVQPRFTGALLAGTPESLGADPYATVVFALEGGDGFAYRDVRRLGTLSLFDERTFAKHDRMLGLEPLDESFTTARLSAFLRLSRQAVKKVLMDQRRVAGIGNIYANEVLWLAGIDPSREARRVVPSSVEKLRYAVVTVLRAAVQARGTTFRDYRDARGERGGYAEHLQVYGRAGARCRRCGTRLAETHAIDGRATVFCFRCQS
jgi:formamidopyrimidine-DNA glycosylase